MEEVEDAAVEGGVGKIGGSDRSPINVPDSRTPISDMALLGGDPDLLRVL